MLRRNGAESLFPKRRGQKCNDGAATQERTAARKGHLLESGGSFGHDRGLRSDNWEMPVDIAPGPWTRGHERLLERLTAARLPLGLVLIGGFAGPCCIGRKPMSAINMRWYRSRRVSGQALLAVVVCCAAGCGPGFFGPPDVDLNTSLLGRDGFSRFSLAGTWLLTNSEGQDRLAVFDEGGDFLSLRLPNDDVFDASDSTTTELLLTSFGALAIKVRGDTAEADGTITLFEFEGWFDDDGTNIRGVTKRVADDLTSSRACGCNETWIRQGGEPG